MIAYGSVATPRWDDRPLAVVGSGPSLRGLDLERLRGPWRVLAVNQKVWDLPFADACFSLDLTWIRNEGQRAVDSSGVPVIIASPDPPQHDPVRGALYLRRSRCFGFSDDPGTVEMGGTSGYGALNVAYLRGARFVVLFGFDYSAEAGDHDNPDRYPWHAPGHNARYWPRWAKNFAETLDQVRKAGMEVLNASPTSNIVAFPRCSVAEGLAALRSEARGRRC